MAKRLSCGLGLPWCVSGLCREFLPSHPHGLLLQSGQWLVRVTALGSEAQQECAHGLAQPALFPWVRWLERAGCLGSQEGRFDCIIGLQLQVLAFYHQPQSTSCSVSQSVVLTSLLAMEVVSGGSGGAPRPTWQQDQQCNLVSSCRNSSMDFLHTPKSPHPPRRPPLSPVFVVLGLASVRK